MAERLTGADLRRLALALPEVVEKLTWDVDITFRVRDKIFAITDAVGDEASIKATLEAQQAMVSSDPETFRVSAYTGRFGWTTVTLARISEAELAELLEDAWRRTAPKKLVAAYQAAHD
jgi:hypothetical protein